MKYKYYFRKPKSEMAKDVLTWLLVAGAVYLAAGSPYFIINLKRSYKKWRRYKARKVSDTFQRLRSNGCIDIIKSNHQIYIGLTERGTKMAGWLQIDALKISKPKKWDGKWRIVMFDISDLKKIYREALRGKLKELGFSLLQKSVWIHPFDCRDEIALLKDFFGLKEEEIRLITAESIGNDSLLKKFYQI